MTKYLAFSASIAALVAALAWPGNADPARHERPGSGSRVTASDVDANLRRSGLTPRGEIIRHGDVFVTHAFDPRGIELRVVAEALFGDIVSIAPRNPLTPYPVRYDSGPRIIHIPGGGMQDRAALPERSEGFDEDDMPVSALPRQRERSAHDERAPRPRRESQRPREPRQVLPYETPYKPRRESRGEPAKPQAKLEVKASRSVLAIPPDPVRAASPVTPRWQGPEKFGAPPESAAPQSPLASRSADSAQASANEPAVAPPSAPDIDLPPEGITVDTVPSR